MKRRIAFLTILVFASLVAETMRAQVVIRDSVTISSFQERLGINPSDSSFGSSLEFVGRI
jgi:hypothetical protein